MNALDLPQHIIDLERQHSEVQFGDVTVKLKKATGKVVKLIAILTKSIRFRDNQECLLYLVDSIKTLPTNRSGVVTFQVEHRNGKVVKIETTSEITTDYPMDTPREIR